MKILMVGSGGREHALLWKLHSDDPSAKLFATRPNPGMARLAEGVDLSPEDVEGISSWADGNAITLTIVGPEVPLSLGLADALWKRGLPVFGPTAAAARIESSKAFAKALMTKTGVPTAEYQTFSNMAAAETYVREIGAPVVVKASGLAAGKGAVVCLETDEALAAVRGMLEGGVFGTAGSEIVVEEYMDGEEISVFAITDGRYPLLLLPSQDHKRIGEGDTGANTGGMGSYAPVPLVTDKMLGEIRDTVFLPILDGLERAGTPFKGLLYAGLMVTDEGLRVVEFNCRFGDPETQAVLPLMESSLLDLLLPVGRGGSIARATCAWRNGAALNTVLASAGYPGTYETGKSIHVPDDLSAVSDVLVFHAGTREHEGQLVTAGGRVLSVVGLGDDLESARDRSLAAADRIEFEGKTLRRDIGRRGVLARARAPGG
jgi:phosphoribosylamine--glycine ligase